jgi:DNA modification methylase
MGNSIEILEGDAKALLDTLDSESVHCCVTSPPYWGLRSYSSDEAELGREPTPTEYAEHLVEIFNEVRRVLRPDGTLWLVLGDSYTTHGNPTGKAGKTARMGSTLKGVQKVTDKRVEGLKPKDLVGIPWRVAFALRDSGWYLRSDIIWCLSGGTYVYVKAQKGETSMAIKDMVRLDPKTVQLWNGHKWSRVLGWNKSRAREGTLEIELRSGERIGCTSGHKWPTTRGIIRADDLHVGDVIKTCRLPEPINVSTPANLPDKDVGWFIGTYIADGSLDTSRTIQIASHVDETARFNRLSKIARTFDATCRMHHTGGRSAVICIDGPVIRAILDAYVSGHGAKRKHLRPKCWARSNRFLRGVLDGYLDGDGHHDIGNRRWRIGYTNNAALTRDLRTLCARIGATISVRRAVHKLDGRAFPGYRGEIRFSRSGHRNEKDVGEIVKIRCGRAHNFWDIGIEGEPHTFALASGVLTHNSKPNPSPSRVKDRPTTAHEYVFLLSKSERYYYDYAAIAVPNESKPGKMKNRRSVWTLVPKRCPGIHIAQCPLSLAELCVKAGSPRGGMVLDPFCGSGTTLVAAKKLGRSAVGIELVPEYVIFARERLETAL